MRAEQFVEPQLLSELAMGPASLRRMAASIDAYVGMEFEMYVPDTESDNDGGDEYEPNYDMDERANSIDDIVEFFSNDETSMNSGNAIQRMREKLEERYYEWADEEFHREWRNEGKDALRDYIVNNSLWDENEAITIALEDLGLSDDEKNRAEKVGIQINARKYNRVAGEVTYNSDDEKHWRAACSAADAKLEEMVEEEWELEGRTYDYALEDYREDWSYPEERDWLRDVGLVNMTDVCDADWIAIDWPHYSSGGGGGSRSFDDIAKEFESMIGRPVASSDRYHGAKRNDVSYVVEPDSSLDEPEDSSDGGVEFVSPPLPLPEMLSDLKKVKAWADSQGCYTNSSTGLHINVSVPGMSESNLDYVKLAILLGDQYVLEQFEREANTYCKSGLDQVKRYARMRPELAQPMMDKMRAGLNKLASRAIHSGSTDKYTSINNKEGYVEFRSPGDDWLGKFYDKIEPTLLRMVVALDAACDPQKSRNEYLKKLYLMLAPSSSGDDTIKYFAQYAAGELPAAALRSFVKQVQLQRKTERNPEAGEKYWYKVSIAGHASSIEVVATSADEAKIVARKEWGIRDIDAPDNAMKAIAIKKYIEPTAPNLTNVGEHAWDIMDEQGNLVHILNGPTTQRDANRMAAGWLTSNGHNVVQQEFEVVPHRINEPQPAAPPQQTAQPPQRPWGRWFIDFADHTQAAVSARDYAEAKMAGENLNRGEIISIVKES